jgi:hypothetical protein
MPCQYFPVVTYNFETCNTVRISKNLSDTFPIQDALKEGNTLFSLLFSFGFEYAIRKDQKHQERLKLNGTHHLLVYADDVNVLYENINTIKKTTETLLEDNKEDGVEVNTEKTKYMIVSRHQNVGQNHNSLFVNNPLKNAANFHSRANEEQVKFGECLLPFCLEFCVFRTSLYELKD